jgi:hypothetical protein
LKKAAGMAGYIRGLSFEERFWAKVHRAPDGCWEWTASCDNKGYGQIAMLSPDGKRRPRKAHIVAAILTGQYIDGLAQCHKCDNPPCCRPSHLFAGSAADNMRDAAAKGRMHRGYKLSDDDVRSIRAMLAAGKTRRDIAPIFSVHPGTITKISIGARHGRVI